MIEPTNIPVALDHASQAVQAGKSFWAENGTVILAFTLWLRSELAKIIEFIEARGGLFLMLLKLFWNPPSKPIAPGKADQEQP